MLNKLIASAVILTAMTGSAIPRTIYTSTLGDNPVLGGGSYTSGGGITVAAEVREFQGQTLICGAWAQSVSQSVLTQHVEQELLQTGSIFANGKAVLRGLGFMEEVDPQDNYAGQPAHCKPTKRPIAEGADFTIRIPKQVVYADLDSGAGVTVQFKPTGPGAHEGNILRDAVSGVFNKK